MAESCAIQRLKWPDRLHYRFPAVRLGSDEHGEWLATPAGVEVLTGQRLAFITKEASVRCVLPGRWWTASFLRRGGGIETYVDVELPGEWRDGDYVSIDLDLDVIRRPDGTVRLEDEDEFAEHRVAFGYPDDVVRTAQETAAALMIAVGRGDEPFGSAGERWIDRAVREAG